MDKITNATILIPVCKREEYLQQHLNLLTKQEEIINCEILVINDGIPDYTEEICKNFSNILNIRYLFTGQRNSSENIIRRNPSYCLNIGVQQTKSDILILTCPEMYLLERDIIKLMLQAVNTNHKHIAITEGKYDNGLFLKHLNKFGNITKEIFNSVTCLELCTIYPFYLALSRRIFMEIGGYDEEFTGVAWDDTDFSRRLQQYGCEFKKLDRRVIHLKHKKFNYDRKDWLYNKKLYDDRNNIVVRNLNTKWGIL